MGARAHDSIGYPLPVIRAYLSWLAEESFAVNQRNILEMIEPGGYRDVCDLGCDDGEWTQRLISVARPQHAFGIEIVPERARAARLRGIEVVVSDLNRPFPLRNGAFDLVHSNQVIEHVSDVDNFLAETYRVLRPGAHAIISTENTSSWHNIFAAAMGWQIFSAANVSVKAGSIGNPLALHRGSQPQLASWTHKTIFGYRGLVEIARAHGFDCVSIRGAGYHPLLPRIGRLDARHAHLLAMKVVKPPVG